LILALVDEAVVQGATKTSACAEVGLSVRTIQRWRAQGGGADARRGPRKPPANKLSLDERQKVLETANLPEFRNLPPPLCQYQ
jgi:transposase